MASWQYLTPDTITTVAQACYRFVLPDDFRVLNAFKSAVSSLLREENWQLFGDLSPAQSAALLENAVNDGIASGDFCMIGVIIAYATYDPPSHSLACDGAIYSQSDYPKLFDAIDPAFLIDATHFAVPDLVGRFPFGATLSMGSPYPIGAVGGEIDHTLTIAEMPSHSHTDAGHNHAIELTTELPVVSPGELPVDTTVPIVPDYTATGFANIQPTGGDGAHNNMPPFFALKYAIIAE